MPNLCDKVVSELSEDIQIGVYQGGTKLPTEAALIERFKVSRSVIREALSRLQAANLVTTKHGVGTYVIDRAVTKLTVTGPEAFALDDALDMLSFRIEIEAGAAAQASTFRSVSGIRRIATALDNFKKGLEHGIADALAHDVDFHLSIAQATGNRYYADLQAQLVRASGFGGGLGTQASLSSDTDSFLRLIYSEHSSIYHAIQRGDPEEARAAMRMHLSHSRRRLISGQTAERCLLIS